MDDAKWPHARLARRTLLSAGAASLGLGVAAIGHATEELRIAYFNDFAPVSYLDGDVMKGVLVDIYASSLLGVGSNEFLLLVEAALPT